MTSTSVALTQGAAAKSANAAKNNAMRVRETFIKSSVSDAKSLFPQGQRIKGAPRLFSTALDELDLVTFRGVDERNGVAALRAMRPV
jgi:hypothetical protein